MDAAELFASNLPAIERAARSVCRRARLSAADAEDFVSAARLALIEDDYAILRKHQGRSSLATYLTIVFHRLLCDERMKAFGRWHSSREAERMGEAGVLLETLVRRDHRSLDEAVPIVQAAEPALSRSEIESMAGRLPQRAPRLRAVEIDAPVASFLAAPERADARALDGDARALSDRTSRVVRETLAALSLEDRMLIRFRFGSAMSIADISRMMRLPQRPLYRRIESLLQRLRAALLAAGLDAGAVTELIGTAAGEMDFGLTAVENAPIRQSLHAERPKAAEESP
jgi:RNA polymerase sigma factor for flagellar operon FliA